MFLNAIKDIQKSVYGFKILKGANFKVVLTNMKIKTEISKRMLIYLNLKKKNEELIKQKEPEKIYQ